MSFFDNFGQKATETTARAVQKAKDYSDIAKFNSVISEEEIRINNLYYQIGKRYLETHPNNYEEEFAELVAALHEAEQKIRAYQQQIQNIKGVTRCSRCGAEIQAGYAFCSACGAPVSREPAMPDNDLVQCPGCGALVGKDMNFCTECGSPMKSRESTVNTPNTSNIPNAPKKKQCPNCATEVEDDVIFCTECGMKIG